MTRFTVIAIMWVGAECRGRAVEVVYPVYARIELSLPSRRCRVVGLYSVLNSRQ